MPRPLRLVPYDPAWPARFAEEAARVRAAVGGRALAVEHVGSTAVPGLAGKPVLDLAVAVASEAAADACVAPLGAIGYAHRGAYGDDPRRRYFVRDADGGRVAQIHLYIVPAPAWDEKLAFRDALRADPALAAAYAAEKRRVAEAVGWDKGAYAVAKGPFVERALAALRAAGRLGAPPPHATPDAAPGAGLRALFGDVDVYLFDQLLRGRVPDGAAVLDAGCGAGRNLVHFLRAGHPVLGADADPRAVDAVRRLAAELAPATPPDAFRAEPVEAMSFPDAAADLVISSAVLHFARDRAHFDAMLAGTWRVLRPGGVLFCRTAGRDGQEGAARPLGGGRYALPDGSERFLVDAAGLERLTDSLGGELLDPVKTTVVHGRRSMTTWVVRRLR